MNVEQMRRMARLLDQAAVPPTEHRCWYDPTTDTVRCACGAGPMPTSHQESE